MRTLFGADSQKGNKEAGKQICFPAFLFFDGLEMRGLLI